MTIANAGTLAADGEIGPIPQGGQLQDLHITLGDTSTPDHGELYVVAYLTKNRGTDNPDLRAVLAAGYITAGMTVTSVLNRRLHEGERVRFQVYAGSEAGNIPVIASLTIETDPDLYLQAGGVVHYEVPGTGPGRMRTVQTADPAAGAVPANIVVPAGVRWLVRGAFVQLVTDANVANRRYAMEFDDGSRVIGGSGAAAVTAALATVGLFFGLGQTNSTPGTRRHFGSLGAYLLEPGSRIVSHLEGIQAGDDFTALNLQVEEWAIP